VKNCRETTKKEKKKKEKSNEKSNCPITTWPKMNQLCHAQPEQPSQ